MEESMLKSVGVPLMTAIFSLNAIAASPSPENQLKPIPSTPSAPPALSQPIPVNPFGCERSFIYQGKVLDCDSNVQQDGENLRHIIRDVPEAVAQLDLYQRNQRDLKNTAYISTIGLGVALLGYAISRPPFEQGAIKTGGYFVMGGLATGLAGLAYSLGSARANGRFGLDSKTQLAYISAIGLGLAILGIAIDHPPFAGGLNPGGYLVLGGLGMSVGSFAFNIGMRKTNETHLQNAVNEYNKARPDRPIELQLSAGFQF